MDVKLLVRSGPGVYVPLQRNLLLRRYFKPSEDDRLNGSEAAGFDFSTHPHMLRHARGFKLANEGQDTRAIQAFLGRRRIESTTIYTALDASRFDGFTSD